MKREGRGCKSKMKSSSTSFGKAVGDRDRQQKEISGAKENTPSGEKIDGSKARLTAILR